MSGKRRGPVGLGYMPKGGVRAAQAVNAEHQRRAATRPAVAANVAPLGGAGAGARERAGAGRSSDGFIARLGLVVGAAALVGDVLLWVTR